MCRFLRRGIKSIPSPWGIVLAAFLTLLVPAVVAQVNRAVLEGTVSDASGRVIAGADVKVMAAATGLTQEQHTNSNGYYRLPGLAVGHYSVTFSNDKFKTRMINDVVLEIGQTRTLDARLDVGAVTEKVEVNASNEPGNRTSAEAGAVIRPDQIADLANNGR